MDRGGRKRRVEKGGAEKKKEKKCKALLAKSGKSANIVELFSKKPVPGDAPGGELSKVCVIYAPPTTTPLLLVGREWVKMPGPFFVPSPSLAWIKEKEDREEEEKEAIESVEKDTAFSLWEQKTKTKVREMRKY